VSERWASPQPSGLILSEDEARYLFRVRCAALLAASTCLSRVSSPTYRYLFRVRCAALLAASTCLCRVSAILTYRAQCSQRSPPSRAGSVCSCSAAFRPVRFNAGALMALLACPAAFYEALSVLPAAVHQPPQRRSKPACVLSLACTAGLHRQQLGRCAAQQFIDAVAYCHQHSIAHRRARLGAP